MLIYVFVCMMIILFGLYLELLNSKATIKTNKKKLPNYFFIIPSFLLLFIISSFRGDFTTDHKNYIYLFKLYNQYDFWEVFQVGLYQETGYIFLNQLVGAFTNNPVYLFVVTTLIILTCFYSQISKHSLYIWVSVLMFVTIGSFYTSFNITRQIIAAAIIFAGSKFLYNRNFLRYLLVVVLAALFHRSAWIMIFFYFILNLKFSVKNLVVLFSASLVSMFYLDSLLGIFQNIFYSVYTENSYGMQGLNFTNAIIPIALLIFSLFHLNKINQTNTIHRVWVNAVIFYAVFSILGLQVQMVQRLAVFFAPYALLLIPLIFSKMKHKELRLIYLMGLVSLLVLYNYVTLSGTGYDPYYFIWDTSK